MSVEIFVTVSGMMGILGIRVMGTAKQATSCMTFPFVPDAHSRGESDSLISGLWLKEKLLESIKRIKAKRVDIL